MQMLYVFDLCASCGSSQCCILHDLQFLNASRGCKRRPYGRGILQSWSNDCILIMDVVNHSAVLIASQLAVYCVFQIHYSDVWW